MRDVVWQAAVVVAIFAMLAVVIAAAWVSLLVDEHIEELRPCDPQDLRNAGREGQQEAHDGEP